MRIMTLIKKMAAREKSAESGISNVLHANFEDDLGDEDLCNFLDFPEEVEEAIAEVITLIMV